MYIESVPNRNSPPCILPRESYRQGGKVKKRTIANLSKWPSELVESFRVLLRGGTVVKHLEESFDVVRSHPYGHVAAVLGTLRKIGLDRVIFVGNRGLITEARIREEIRPVKGLEWITALRASRICKLVDSGSLQLSLFDEKDLAEITDPSCPGERLVVCRNPMLAEERGRKRRELLKATEKELEKIARATKRGKRPLKGKDNIAGEEALDGIYVIPH